MDEKHSTKGIENVGIEEQSIDEILNESGLATIRQILIQLNFTCFVFFTCYHIVLSYFTGYIPSWRCKMANSSEFCLHNINKTITQNDFHFQQRCHLQRDEWNYTTDNKYSFVTEFALDCGKTYLAALVSSSFYVGGVISAMINGKIASMYGRKLSLIGFSILTVIASIASSYVSAVWQLIVLNLARGAGHAGLHYMVLIYQAELSPPKYRVLLSTIVLLFGSCSYLYVDLLAYYVRTWRELSTYATLPCLPFLIGFFFLPESPRWLLTIGQKTKAVEILKMFSKCKNFQMKSIQKEKCGKSSFTYLDMFRKFQVFKQTSAVLFLWFTIPILYYTIALQAGSFGGNMYISFALSTAADLPSSIILICICDFIGRKKTILGNILICSVLLPVIALIPQSVSCRYILTTALAMVARCAITVSFNGAMTWSNEIFPTVVRSQGMYLSSALDRFGCVTVPFIVRLLKNWNYKAPFFVVSCVGLIATLIGLTLPETGGKPTRETFEDFFEKPSEQNKDSIGMENRGMHVEESVFMSQIKRP